MIEDMVLRDGYDEKVLRLVVYILEEAAKGHVLFGQRWYDKNMSKSRQIDISIVLTIATWKLLLVFITRCGCKMY